MKKNVVITAFAVALTALLITGGAAAAVKDFAGYAPDDTQNCIQFPYAEENVQKIKACNAYKMLTCDEMTKMVEEMLKMVPKREQEDVPLLKAGLGWSDVVALQCGGFALFYNVHVAEPPPAPEANPDVPAPDNPTVEGTTTEGAFLMDCANPEIKALVEKLNKALNDLSEGEKAAYVKSEAEIDGVKTRCYTRMDEEGDETLVFESADVTVFAESREIAAKIIACVKGEGKGSLAQNDLYKATIAKLDQRSMITFFGNGKSAMGEIEKEAKNVKEAGKIMKMLNAESILSMGIGTWAEDGGIYSHLYLHCPDGKFALLKPLEKTRAQFDTLSAAGKRAFFTLSLSAEPTEIYDHVLSMIKASDENAHKQAVQAIEGMEKQLGIKFKDDLLGALGGEMTLVMNSPSLQLDAQILPVPAALVLELKNREQFEKAFGTLCEKLQMERHVEKYADGKHTIELLPYFTMCISDKHCVLANSVRTMEDVLDAMDGNTARLSDTPLFKTAQKALGGEAAMFCYFSMKDITRMAACMMRLGEAFGPKFGLLPPPPPPAPQPEGGQPGEEAPPPGDEEIPDMEGCNIADNADDEDAEDWEEEWEEGEEPENGEEQEDVEEPSEDGNAPVEDNAVQPTEDDAAEEFTPHELTDKEAARYGNPNRALANSIGWSIYDSETGKLCTDCPPNASKELRAVMEKLDFTLQKDREQMVREFVRIMGSEHARKHPLVFYDSVGKAKYVWPWPKSMPLQPVPEPPQNGTADGEMNPLVIMKQMSIFLRLLGEHCPAVFMAARSDKEGLHIRIAMP